MTKLSCLRSTVAERTLALFRDGSVEKPYLSLNGPVYPHLEPGFRYRSDGIPQNELDRWHKAFDAWRTSLGKAIVEAFDSFGEV